MDRLVASSSSGFSRFHTTAWAVTGAIMAIRLAPAVLMGGMFFDGVVYAAIARNLAVGKGDVWSPVFTDTVFAQFHEHPPLAFFLQSLLFRIFGDYFWVEKAYSAATGIVTASLIAATWRTLADQDVRLRRLTWLPVLVWVLMPNWGWAYGNNLLENTLGVFTALAVYASLRALVGARMRLGWLVLAAAALTCAVFTKGPVGLFPLTAIGLGYLCLGHTTLQRAVCLTFALVALCAALMGAVLLDGEARESCLRYLNTQVLAAVAGARDVNPSPLGRFFIVEKIVMQLLPLVVAALVLRWASRRRGIEPGEGVVLTVRRPSAVFCLGVALSASVPLMLSPKQHGHYALPAYPYFALALAFWCAPAVLRLGTRASDTPRAHGLVRWGSFAVCSIVIAFCAIHREEPYRDRQLYHDNLVLSRTLPRHAVIGASRESVDLAVCSYLYRWHYVSLAADDRKREFWLQPLEHGDEAAPPGYAPVDVSLLRYRLYRQAP